MRLEKNETKSMKQAARQTSRTRDNELIARVVAQDKTAMKDIYMAYAPALGGFIRLYLANPNDVADILHDTMLEVWMKAARFEGRSSLKTWIFSIARYKAIDKNRKQVRIHYSDELIELEDEAPDPAEVLEISQDMQFVRLGVEQLKPDHRRAVHLSYFEDLTYKEIAEIEGCPEGTIKTRILYAKRHLRHILRDLKNKN